ncbi:hypothetical protein DMB65_07315 [Flavobacterium cheongpyeongense]|uniref:Secretion system C-terminal sorting domain-containing protein n=1 Tax=Flavobacterium cheongpyeongense TaxID=2212651 RepID=A0A2V4C6C7_9FLAO|nr:T9SS type A sorting domain-containing protein [Flavobacterium cheongpyeongense]PXY41744.1 hypothetical protein DMB65_07315 [Flavobacterium cheongpyeongense]
MKPKLLLLLLLANFAIYAQYTSIPDVNFENKLIALGIDSGTTDGQVLTSNIDKLTSLDVSNSSITDLTGIQDFVSLKYLHCHYNKLTTLDLSKNTALIYLYCRSNQLTSLDLSKNTALETLDCHTNSFITLDLSKNIALKDLTCSYNSLTTLNVSKNIFLENLTCDNNQLTTVDLSENTALKTFVCDNNQLPTLDLSKNTALIQLTCNSNPLTALDLSNNTALVYLQCIYNPLTTLDLSMNTALQNLSCFSGSLTTLDLSKNTALKSLDCHSNKLTTLDLSNNTALDRLHCYSNQLISLNLKNGKNSLLTDLKCNSNPNLNCIDVDDVSYSNTNWPTSKDITATYSLSCSTLGIKETAFDKIAVYPNPVKGELHIDNSTLEKASVYDTLGKLITTTKFANGLNNNTINLAGLQNGIYYIYLENEGATIVKKIIVD